MIQNLDIDTLDEFDLWRMPGGKLLKEVMAAWERLSSPDSIADLVARRLPYLVRFVELWIVDDALRASRDAISDQRLEAAIERAYGGGSNQALRDLAVLTLSDYWAMDALMRRARSYKSGQRLIVEALRDADRWTRSEDPHRPAKLEFGRRWHSPTVLDVYRRPDPFHRYNATRRVDSPSRFALFEVLGDSELAVQVDLAARAAPDEWRGTLAKQRTVKRAILDVVEDESKVEPVFDIILGRFEY